MSGTSYRFGDWHVAAGSGSGWFFVRVLYSGRLAAYDCSSCYDCPACYDCSATDDHGPSDNDGAAAVVCRIR